MDEREETEQNEVKTHKEKTNAEHVNDSNPFHILSKYGGEEKHSKRVDAHHRAVLRCSGTSGRGLSWEEWGEAREGEAKAEHQA